MVVCNPNPMTFDFFKLKTGTLVTPAMEKVPTDFYFLRFFAQLEDCTK